MGTVSPTPVSREELAGVVAGQHTDPHRILGPHPAGSSAEDDPSGGATGGAHGVTLRVLQPLAEQVTVVVGEVETELTHEHGGVWVGALPATEVSDYRLRVRSANGTTVVADDPYRFWPTLGELDLHLLGEGRHERLWEVLGAHVHTYQTTNGPVSGTSFAVWAPNAQGVRVVADFNHWDGRAHPMRSLGRSGVWELFVPGIGDGAHYKYDVLGHDGLWRHKADPMAFATEEPPATASRVFTSTHQWGDAEWLRRRAERAAHTTPMSVYEVHLGSWRRGRTYRELADGLTAYVSEMGFTHVELLPVAEHPFGGSWGYQVSSYFAPTARFGDPDDFRYLVDRLHQAGIGVFVDWVPAHFPKDEWALAQFDGTPLYEHADPRRGEHPDWGTLVFDFGRHEVRNFLVANALYWLEEFHIDGLRVDAVASMLYLDYSRADGEWTPNHYGGRENLDAVAFLQETNATCYRRVPGIVTIAEESTAWPGVTRPTHLGGLGFGFKWNMGWMHDSLEYVQHDPLYRQYHHQQLTFSLVYAFSENYVLPISHDEVVHGKGSLLTKMPGDRWQQLANLRAYLAFMWAHPGKQLLFMGQEFAQGGEWAEQRELEWSLLESPEHAGVRRLVADLNQTYFATSALWEQDSEPDGFSWIEAGDAAGNVISFLRYDSAGSTLACITNFSANAHRQYRAGLPVSGRWAEVLNTDADVYGGSGLGNLGEVHATDGSWHGLPASATLTLPPLGTVWLRPEDASS